MYSGQCIASEMDADTTMSFIESQNDYITFLYGLIFIILGGVALIQKFIGHSRIHWVWLGVFGLLHGLHEWLMVLSAALPEARPISLAVALTGFASFAALIEFARYNWHLPALAANVESPQKIVHRALRHWPAFGLMLLAPVLLLTTGANGLKIATQSAALVGGLWAALMLAAEGRQTLATDQRRWLLVAAGALGGFCVAESLSAWLPITSAFGVSSASIEAAHALFPALTTLAVWRYIQLGRSADGDAVTNNYQYSLWLVSSLIIVLAIGWYATEQLGRNAETGVRDRSKGATDILASHLRDEMARADLMATLLARSPYVQMALERRDEAAMAAAETAMRQHTAVLESSLAFLMAPNGKVLASTGEAGDGRRQGADFGFLPYFQDSSAYGLVGKDLAVEPDLENRGYYVSHPVNGADGRPLGVAVVKKVLAQTDKEFKRFRDWFLISPNGVVFLSSRPQFLLQPLWSLPETTRQQLVRSGEFGPGPFTGGLLESAPADRAKVSWEGHPALANLVEVRSDGWTALIIENLDAVAVQRLYGILATAAVALFTLCFFIVVQRETAYESRLASDQQRLKALNEELERQATTDSLTGLYNRLKFNALLLAEIDRAKRYGTGFMLVILDVDFFKRINDTWGHQTGDIVLLNLARLARDTMRSSDALARWGGEEFVAILPMTDVNGALYFTERVAQALASFSFDPVPKVTCSFGVTQYVPGDTPESMTQRADEALYLAKENGRNRTEVTLADAAA